MEPPGTHEQDTQSRCTFRAKFTMEDEDGLAGSVAADGRFRLERVGTQKKLFYSSGRIDVEGARDVPAVVLVIKPTVNDVV